jgi:hypothetical protein
VSIYEKIPKEKRKKKYFQNGVKQYVKNHLRFEIITKNQSFLTIIF